MNALNMADCLEKKEAHFIQSSRFNSLRDKQLFRALIMGLNENFEITVGLYFMGPLFLKPNALV